MKRKATEYALSFYLLCSLVSCGLLDSSEHDPNSFGSGTCPDATPAFITAFGQTEFRSELRRNCAGCHSSESPLAPSYFADPNLEVAFAPARQFVDFSNPSQSFFVKRMQSGHNCGSNCGQWATGFARQIEAWAARELAVTPRDCIARSLSDNERLRVVETPPQIIPNSLTLGVPLKLTYDLSQAKPPVSRAAFRITVQRFTDSFGADLGSYQLSGPILAIAPFNEDPRANVAIRDIAILFGGTEELPYRNYRYLNYTILPKSFVIRDYLPFPVVSPLVQLVDWHQPAGDSVSFRFTIERTADRPTPNPDSCKREDIFIDTVYPLFTDKVRIPAGSTENFKCVSCHGLNGGEGFTAFPMVGSANPCEEFRKRVNFTNPNGSLLLNYSGSNNHGPNDNGEWRFTLSAADRTEVVNWINLEK